MDVTAMAAFLVCAITMGIFCLTDGYMYRVGHIQVIQNHSDLNGCATKVLEEGGSVGGRVSTITGTCEGLGRKRWLNDPMKSGYAYFKKTNVTEEFEPPMIGCDTVWWLPVVFGKGAKVEITITTPVHPWGKGEIGLRLTTLATRNEYIEVSFLNDRIEVGNSTSNETTELTLETNKTYTISFVAENSSVKTFVNNVELKDHPVKSRLNLSDMISTHYTGACGTNSFHIHSFMSTAA